MFDVNKIYQFFKKNFTKTDVLILFSIVIIYFVTRLINLEKLPIFGDEGIYIRWAKTAWIDAFWRFISLTDGRQPFQTWGTIPFLKLFPNNAFLAGRLFAVATGFVGLIGMFVLIFYLFGKKTAFIGTFLYVLTPFFLFYDRMALADSAVNASFIWIFFLSIVLANTHRLDIALIYGLISGVGLLIKSSVKMFVSLSILAPILFFETSLRKFIPKTINYIVLFLISLILSTALYNIQRLSPFFHFVSLKNNTFVMTFSEFLKNPFSYFPGNMKVMHAYILNEVGWIIGFFALLGFIFLAKKNKRLFLYFFSWILIPYIAIAFFSKVLYPRYLIFFASLTVIFASYYLSQLKKIQYIVISLFLIFGSFIFLDYYILFNPANLPFPEIDRGQYIKGATAGWGVREIIQFARVKSKEKPVIILAEGDFGVVRDQLEVFVNKGEKIYLKGYWPLNEQSLNDNKKELSKNYVFVVFSQLQKFPAEWPIRLIKKFDKPNSQLAIRLFELTK